MNHGSGQIQVMVNVENNEKIAQAICTSCGLCCDGSLFARARLTADDLNEHLAKAEILALHEADKIFFHLPCHHLENRHCNIYHMWRPDICSRFKCKVLRRLVNGEISFEQGMEIVKKALLHIAEIKVQAGLSGSLKKIGLRESFSYLVKKQKNQNHALMLSYTALIIRFKRDFISAANILET
jgi:hypothetical protein